MADTNLYGGIPLMAMVDRPSLMCCASAWVSPMLNIPSGVYTLTSFFGKDSGVVQPGY